MVLIFVSDSRQELAVSTRGSEIVVDDSFEDFFRGVEPEGFAWPVVQLVGDGVQERLMAGDLHALREVLADQAVRVLVRRSFPR